MQIGEVLDSAQLVYISEEFHWRDWHAMLDCYESQPKDSVTANYFNGFSLNKKSWNFCSYGLSLLFRCYDHELCFARI